jgi:hypothetical protein
MHLWRARCPRRQFARAVRGVPIVEAIVGFDDRWHLNAPAPVAEGALLDA